MQKPIFEIEISPAKVFQDESGLWVTVDNPAGDAPGWMFVKAKPDAMGMPQFGYCSQPRPATW